MIAARVSAYCGDLGPQVVEIDLALLSAGLDDDDPQSGHHRAGRVGAVRAGRNQADVAMILAIGAQVVVDREQPGELALRPGVGLQRHGVVAGDLGQPAAADRRTAAGNRLPASSARTGACRAKPGRLIGSISVVALSFIVHEPSGIMPRSSA